MKQPQQIAFQPPSGRTRNVPLERGQAVKQREGEAAKNERMKDMNDQTKSPWCALVEQAIKNYEEALQTGVRIQEESSKWWTEFMQSGAPAEWRQRWGSSAMDNIPVVQQRMEDALHLLEQGSRTSLDLMKRAMEVAMTETPAEAQGKLQDLWGASLQALRGNGQAVAQANAKVVEAWMQLFSRAAAPGAAKQAA
jgi:hypothetical protein